MSTPLTTGQLVLVATPIGNLGDLPPRAVEAMRDAALICCEDTRRTGRLLQHAGISGVRMAVTNDHTEHQRIDDVLGLLGEGRTVAIVTDAGTPGISDPGERLVRAAVEAGYPVTAIPGPAALIVGLVLSGLDTTRFVFEGFIPRSGGDRTSRLAEIATERRTVVIYEAPHRIVRTVVDLAQHCGGERRIAIARELTKMHEEVWRGTLADATAHVGDVEPRGEYVVVIEGAPAAAAADDDGIREALVLAIDSGVDRKTAIATVTLALGVQKRRVFDIAISLPRP